MNEQENDEVGGQEAFNGCQKASASRDSCLMSSKCAEQLASRTPLSFPDWRARRLINLDVQFLAWLAFTYALYGVKTTKLLCHQAASLSGAGQTCTTAAVSFPLSCSWAWQVTCGSAAISSRRGWLGALPALFRSNLLCAVKAAMSPFFAAWMMSDYGVGISLVEMLLWVAVIVTPRLCRSYIRRPALRCTLLLGHRYAKLLGCWLSLGVVADDHVGLALMGYFVTLGQYAFSGWQNSMTLIPLRMLAVCGLAEWLLICHLITALRKTYPAVAFTHYSNAALFCMSFVLVFAAPMAITAAVERRHKKQYRLYTASFAPAAAPAVVQQHMQEQAAETASASNHVVASSRRLAHILHGESSITCIDSCKAESDASRSSSNAADSDHGRVGPDSVNSSMDCDPVQVDGDAAATVEYLKPRLEALLGASSAEQILGSIKPVTAGVARSAAGSSKCSLYTPMCTTTNASIKVSTDHSDVATLGPLLHASLLSALSGNSSSSATPVIHSACFEGCVQMVALLYALKRGQHSDGKADDQMHAASDEAAKTLLQSVQQTLAEAAAAGGSAAKTDAHLAAVQVQWADAYAAKEAEHQAVGSSMQQQREIQPAEAAATACNACPSATAGATAPALNVRCIKPACLIAGSQQTLHVQLRGSPPGSSSSCVGKYRVLVFKDTSVLVTKVIKVDMSAPDCSAITLPAITSPGVLQVCLVPLEGSVQSQLSGVMHQPVLVLPAAAAAEVQQLWGTTAAPVVDDSHSPQQHDQAEWEAIAAISADVAFLLGGSNSGGDSAANEAGRLSPEKAVVLKHLLVFLAQNGCWDTMKFVVDATATAAAAGQGSTLAIAPESSDCTQARTVLKSTSQDSATAQATVEADAVQGLATPKANRKLEHSTSNASTSSAGIGSNEDRCDACGCSYAKLPSVSSKTAPREAATAAITDLASAAHAPDISAWRQAAAAELCITTDSSSMKYNWRCASLHLLHGFRCPALEVAYLSSVAAQTRVSDVIAAVYYLVMALSFRVLTDDLSLDCSSKARGCVLEGLGRMLYFGLFTLPSLVLVVGRKQLMMSGRRESAALLCELCLCVLPLLSSLGVIRHGPYITSMYQSNSWHSIIIFWFGMGVYRMGCRQVRTRLLLPILACECLLAIHWCRRIQSPLSFSLLKYGGVMLAASLAGSAFELTSRRRFLLGVMATPITAAT